MNPADLYYVTGVFFAFIFSVTLIGLLINAALRGEL